MLSHPLAAHNIAKLLANLKKKDGEKKNTSTFVRNCKTKNYKFFLLGPGDPSRDKQSGVAKPETDMLDIPP